MDEAKTRSTDKLVDPKKAKEPLTLDGLLSQLKAKGLVPVRVVDSFSFGRKKLRLPVLDFEGTLSEFIDTAVSLRSKAVFVSAFEFDEEEFFYESEIPEEDLTPTEQAGEPTPTRYRIAPISRPGATTIYRREPILEDPAQKIEAITERIDLLTREPRLKPFHKRVDQHFKYVVSCFCSKALIRLQITEAWYTDFKVIRYQTTIKIDDESDAKIIQQREKLAQDYKKQEDERSAITKTLLDDSDLVNNSQSTSYQLDKIKDKYPEFAAKLGEHGLKNMLHSLREDFQKQRTSAQQRRLELLGKLKQVLRADEEFMSLNIQDRLGIRLYLDNKHKDSLATLDEQTLNEFIYSLREDVQTQRALAQQKRAELIGTMKPVLRADKEFMSLSTNDRDNMRYYLDNKHKDFSAKLDEQTLNELIYSLREDYQSQRASAQQKRAELIVTMKPVLRADEEFMSLNMYDRVSVRSYLGNNHKDFSTKLDEQGLQELLYSLREDFDKLQREKQIKINKERAQNLASFKTTLPEDSVLMSYTNKISMRTYLLDKHPELFSVLLPTKRDQDDFINWLYLQKQKKRS